jgi:molecular chaperone GrpE
MSDHPQSPDETSQAATSGDPDSDAQATLAAENAALKEQVLRYAADAENVRRRAERETNDARAYAIQKFARDLLAVADTLGRALATPPASVAFCMSIGLNLISLDNALERAKAADVLPASARI